METWEKHKRTEARQEAVNAVKKNWREIEAEIERFAGVKDGVERDTRFNEQHKHQHLAELVQEHEAKLLRFREKGLEAAETADRVIEGQYQEAKREGEPSGVAVWQEAAARAQFVREDAERMSPAEIVAAYRQAKEADDGAGVFLWGRYGVQQLEVLATVSGEDPEEVPHAAVMAAVALGDLRREVDGGAKAKRDQYIGEVSSLEALFHQPLTEHETREFAGRFGIQPEHVTIHGLGEE